MAVTKEAALADLEEALSCGVRVFGENRVQEFLKKYEVFGAQAEWHFIGHLQRNKAKYLAGRTALLHSLDSIPLAEVLEKLAQRHGVTWRVLVQVNVSGEATKHGVAPAELEAFLGALQKFRGLEVCGLMTIAPYRPDPEEARPYFRRLRELRDEMQAKYPELPLAHLSMGMSGDFEVAVEEGATLVRIGSAIFKGDPGGR